MSLMARDRKSTRLNSSHLGISYAVFCLKKNKEPTPLAGPDPQAALAVLVDERVDVDVCADRGESVGVFCFFFNDTATTEIYTLSLHDALPICAVHHGRRVRGRGGLGDDPGG